MLLNQIIDTYISEIKNQTLISPRCVTGRLAIYGCGDLCRMALEYFNRIGIEVSFAVDRNAHLYSNDPFWNGIEVINPNEVDSETKNSVLLAVCVVTSPYKPISTELTASGWTDIVPFYDITEAYRDIHPLSNGWFAKPFTDEDVEKIKIVLSGWGDEISRLHYIQFIAWRRLREEWVFESAPVTTSDRFFIPEIISLLGSQEVFVDIGAHYGAVLSKFIDHVNGGFSRIIAIEPDQKNINELNLNINQHYLQYLNQIEILPFSVGKSHEILNFFNGLGYASQLTALSKDKVQVYTVDELCLYPTYIKFHLEGGELDALKGAINTIHQSRPIIAVTSYHNSLGLMELPIWMIQNMPDYMFLMRLHSYCGTGAVIYAIPQERYIFV